MKAKSTTILGSLLFGVFVILLSGCVSKSDYEALQRENTQLKSRLNELEQELSYIKPRYMLFLEAEKERAAKQFYTEVQALDYIKDYYKFYNRDYAYRSTQVRRLDDNSFAVSLQQCINKPEFTSNNFFWQSMVLNLTINNDGTYKIGNATFRKE